MLTEQAVAALRRVFGFGGLRPAQEPVVEHVLAGGDAFVLMPTGGGKSLCYQLPAVVRTGTALVISPLIALMQDQVEGLRLQGVAVEDVFGQMPYGPSALSADEAKEHPTPDILSDTPDWLLALLKAEFGPDLEGLLAAMSTRAPV